ncbi:MAG: hypothetical protein ACYCXC_18105 [Acidovorax defluvii]|jgi:hypothetical protein|uniref:hypothetical protein n=1 Tax=Acidovorax sp. JHL-3 TaxID=1276755 RepID=UPI00046761EE|nr:hypothetical protein [Acidovorax sp. JHL-3]MCL5740253.1 hypothetical protein [Betaproteobacteria bacterium]
MKRCCAPAASPVWRTVRLALAAVATAGVLAGCSSVPAASSAGDAARSQQGASGITVFGDIDVGVTRQRTR